MHGLAAAWVWGWAYEEAGGVSRQAVAQLVEAAAARPRGDAFAVDVAAAPQWWDAAGGCNVM